MSTAQQVTYDRPPEGLARGRFPAPPWVILALAAVVIVTGIVFLILRARAPRPPVDVLQTPEDPPKR